MLRGFTRSVFDDIDLCSQEYTQAVDPMVPEVNFVRQAGGASGEDSELDKEIFLLEREIAKEIEEISDLHDNIQV